MSHRDLLRSQFKQLQRVLDRELELAMVFAEPEDFQRICLTQRHGDGRTLVDWRGDVKGRAVGQDALGELAAGAWSSPDPASNRARA